VKKVDNAVLWWLRVGLIMVFFQVVIGGITRLTESGLSITKWEVVSGTLPPITQADWDREFELYKDTPQYKEINEAITMEEFKFIYFWEYIHRLWARIMGFVFLIPFLWFWRQSRLTKTLIKDLGIVVLLAALAATFGWIMVASGLIERPWVNAYKLSIHLGIAFCVFSYLLWTTMKYQAGSISPRLVTAENARYRNILVVFIIILCFQIVLGGIISGMKAAVLYPSWPSMNGIYLPDVLFDMSQWKLQNFIDYDKNEFMGALIHFLHRNNAYILLLTVISLGWSYIRSNSLDQETKRLAIVLVVGVLIQMLFGIITVVSSIGKIPVSWGVIHQGMALIVLGISLGILFRLRYQSNPS